MDTSGSNDLYSAGKQKQGSNSVEQLKARYPRIYNYCKTVPTYNLSKIGYCNCAARLGVFVEDIKKLLNVFMKGEKA